MFPVATSVAARGPAFATWALLVANILAFMLEMSLPPPARYAFLQDWGLVPARFFHPREFALATGKTGAPEPLAFLTNTFLHAGFFHILANMWMLWLLGRPVEARLGTGVFTLFYLAGGLAASLAHAVMNQASAIPALGASGAVAAVIGAFMRLFPTARMMVLIPIIIIPWFIELPAALFAGLWFLFQLLQGAAASGQAAGAGGVAWWAHIGGFILGALIAPWLAPARRRNRGPPGPWGRRP